MGDLVGAGNVTTGLYESGFDVINKKLNVPQEIKYVYDAYGFLFTPERHQEFF